MNRPEFTTHTLNNLCTIYKLTPIEIMCVILFWSLDNKILAWSYTIGIQSKSKNKDVLTRQFFAREGIQKFIMEQQNNFIVNNSSVEVFEQKRFDVEKVEVETKTEKIKEEVARTFGIIEDITSDNIKTLLINELNCSVDPEKRAALLLRASTLFELITPEETDLLQPQIYLPARCQVCPKYTQTNVSQTNI